MRARKFNIYNNIYIPPFPQHRAGSVQKSFVQSDNTSKAGKSCKKRENEHHGRREPGRAHG